MFGPAEKQKIAKTGQMVVFDKDGEGVAFSVAATSTNKSALDMLLIGGVPLNEPGARYGPFVMNTNEEILQAAEDYRNGKMGGNYYTIKETAYLGALEPSIHI